MLLMAGAANAQLSTTVILTPADAGRTHVDVGGAWDGSSDVSASGDRVFITISNPSSTDTVFDLNAVSTLPTGFIERTASLNVAVSGTGVCGAPPSISVARNVDDLEFDFGGYDLPADCELSFDFGVIAPSGMSAGTYVIGLNAEGADSDGGAVAFTDSDSDDFLAFNGALILEKTPNVQTAKVGDGVSWTVSARNSGLGGLFDVVIDESAIGTGLTLDNISVVSPTSPAPVITGQTITVPYLAPDEVFAVTVDASVAQCTRINNVASTRERNGIFSQIIEGSVQLDIDTPQITYSVSSTPVTFDGTGNYTVTINNTGAGNAQSFVLDTTLENSDLNVVSVSPDWSYNSSTGEVSLDSGTLAAGASQTVTITIEDDNNKCSVPGGITTGFVSTFTDDCGTAFSTPTTLGTLSFNETPSITIIEQPSPRIQIAQSTTFSITVSAENALSFDDDPVIVNYTLPLAIEPGALLSPSVGTVTCGGACGGGSGVVWSIPRADLVADQTLQIGITTTDDPCAAGAIYTNLAAVETSYSGGVCQRGSQAPFGFLLSNNTEFSSEQNFNQIGGPFETGAPDDGDDIRQEGEGEQGRLEAEYDFDTNDPGVWTGTTHSDDFGGIAGVRLNASSLEYNLNDNGWVQAPAASITGGTDTFTLDLTFLNGVDVNTTVAGDNLKLRYRLTAPDSILGGGVSRRADQFIMMRVKSGLETDASCKLDDDVIYTQGERINWQRADGEVAVSLQDEIVDVCELLDARVSVSNANNGFPIRNLLASLNLGSDYELVLPSTPIYGGALGGGASVTYDSGNQTIVLNDETLGGAGTATIRVRRRATADNQGGAISAQIDYDDNETAPLNGRVFTKTASDTPTLVNTAELDIFVAPNTLPSPGKTVSWVITVRNTKAGVAANTQISDIVPLGLTITPDDVIAMDVINPFAVSSTPTSVLWDVGGLGPGGEVKLTVVATVNGTTCNIPAGSNQINAQWGCGGVVAQSSVNTRPV
jgi:uncharacterized repeat protein (TIGR01451 family)